MDIRTWFCCAALCCLAACRQKPSDSAGAAASATNLQQFAVKGVVRDLKPDGRTVVIKHEAIPGFMDAMTMPFKVKEPSAVAGLKPGDEVTFRLLVTEDESWIDRVTKTGRAALDIPAPSPPPTNAPPSGRHPLMEFKFTNELGQAVSLSDFKGRALAMTFFFTRCPIPEYCPRLSKNFQEAAQELAARPGAPTNWHFLSVTIDTEFDRPEVLRAYGERYGYAPAHWSFLTGPAEQIGELARQSGLSFEREGAFFNHGFRTLIIDPAGRLQMSFPIGGDLSDAIVEEILKAAALTNRIEQPKL
jgi:protein SCO1/2